MAEKKGETKKKPAAKKASAQAKRPIHPASEKLPIEKPRAAAKTEALLLDADNVTATASSYITVEYLPEAKNFAPRKNIHARKIIPDVPEGDQVSDNNPTPPLALDMAETLALRAMMGGGDGLGDQPLANTDNITLVTNVQLSDLATADTASHVCEPSVATNGDVVLYTGNWFAAVSFDGGQTFQYIDPRETFPDPPGMKFCCDQIVHYIKKIDTFVWLLQYSRNQSGENIQRLAFATTADVRERRWRIFDISSQSVAAPGMWLDYPDLAVGTNMLYMTSNAFVGNAWRQSVLVRLPLSGIASGNITAQKTSSPTHPSFRVAQNCATRAFWASHNTTSSLRVFSWGENEPQPSFRDVTIPTWANGPYRSITPDDHNWLGRCDRRLVGAAKTGNEIWFAWCSGPGGANNRPHPFVQIARIRATSLNLIESINLWDAESAISYAALATNAKGEVGVSYMIGGGIRYPTHVVGILTGTRKEVVTFTGERGPDDNQWGDYLTVRRHSPNGNLFSASGFILQTGDSNSDAVPSFTIFGRSGDIP